MVTNRRPWVLLLAAVFVVSGCSRYDVIPDRLEPQINKNVTYQEVEHSPTNYKGQTVVFGGEVLSTKRLADKTQVEVLQLPLSDEYIPIDEDRTRSNGRFLAYDTGREILDPATLPKETLVTVVGEVTGSRTAKVDGQEYEYLTVRIKDLTTWDKRRARYPWYGYGYPYYGGYMYGARPFGFYW